MSTINRDDARILLADATARAEMLATMASAASRQASIEVGKFASRLAVLVAGAQATPVSEGELDRFHETYDAAWQVEADKGDTVPAGSADREATRTAINGLLTSRAASQPTKAIDRLSDLPAQWRSEAAEQETKSGRVAMLNCAFQLEHRLSAIGEG